MQVGGDFRMRRLIIGMTGSTGAIFGVRMLEALKASDIESHLIISKWAQRTLEHETRYTVEQVRGLADVVHKERRRLVLVVRETPLSEVHLENMLKLARMGASIVPPMPAFYNHPQTVDDIVNHIVARVLDQFGIPAPFAKRWDGHLHTATRIATVASPTAKSGP